MFSFFFFFFSSDSADPNAAPLISIILSVNSQQSQHIRHAPVSIAAPPRQTASQHELSLGRGERRPAERRSSVSEPSSVSLLSALSEKHLALD